MRNRHDYSSLNPEGNNRQGYQTIPSVDPEGSGFGHAENPTDEADITDDHKREEVQQEGWSMLGWSFIASATLTVSRCLVSGHY